jgi:xanthine dehydrogenase/oxidase
MRDSLNVVSSIQVTGEALYTDDVPLPANALHAALVNSIRPHAKILSVNPSAALQVAHLMPIT